HEVLFPEAGGGVVAVETLAAGAGARIAILHANAGSGHKSAAVALAHAVAGMAPDATVRAVDTLVFASRFYRSTYTQGYNAMAQRAPRARRSTGWRSAASCASSSASAPTRSCARTSCRSRRCIPFADAGGSTC